MRKCLVVKCLRFFSFFGASRFAHCVRSRRAIRGSLRSYLHASRLVRRAERAAATIPLAKKIWWCGRYCVFLLWNI
jgi:hypothetical protein